MQWISEKTHSFWGHACKDGHWKGFLSDWVLWAEQKSMFACDAKSHLWQMLSILLSPLYSSVYSPNWPFDPMHFPFQIVRVLAYWLGSRHLIKVQLTQYNKLLVWTCWRSLEFFTSIKRRLNDIFSEFYFFIIRSWFNYRHFSFWTHAFSSNWKIIIIIK